MFPPDRRRWYVLVVSSTLYLCSYSYWFAVAAMSVVELLCYALITSVSSKRPNGKTIAIECAIRIATIVVGTTINAFVAYVFDLSFFYGLQWLYFAVTAFFYVYGMWLDKVTRGRFYIDHAFGVVSLSTLVFFMNFVTYGEPYTFLVQMIFIASVIGLSATTPSLGWWTSLIFVFFWVFAIVIGVVVNRLTHKEYRYSVSDYFSRMPF